MQSFQQESVVWREVYSNEYSSLDLNYDVESEAENKSQTVQSRSFLDEGRLYVFPVQNPPSPNDSVILLPENSLPQTTALIVKDEKRRDDSLRVSLQQHAAIKPQNLLRDGFSNDETSLRTPSQSPELSSDEWLRQLGRTPTRDEINAFRKSRHKPTSRGVWLFRDTQEDEFARFASASQYQIILAEGLWMMSQGHNGRRAAWRGFGATAVTGMLTVAVKKTWRRRRPYPNDQKFGTFPSGHTSTVFAMATVMANASPRHKWLAYSSAAAVGWSRVKVRAHHPQDVFAGALLGYIVGKKFAPKNYERINAPIANINFKF